VTAKRRPVPAIELGGSHVTAALVDVAAGEVLSRSARRADIDPSGSAEEILGAIVACGRQLRAAPDSSWGVALPGPFDYERGVGLFQSVGKFESLYGIDVRAALAGELPGPPASITFVNDAEAFMWGERLYGAAAGSKRCAGITLGTGIGSAFFADESVQRQGPGVPPEGRVDLLEVDGAPLEDQISTRALVREYDRRTRTLVKGAAEIAERARAGDLIAREVLESAFHALGAALRPWLRRFGTECLVAGGAMTGSWDLIGPALSSGLGAGPGGPLEALVVRVAAHPADAALLGAAARARPTEAGEL
jgi:glucokinase